MDRILSLPPVAAIAILTVIVFCRAQGTYWLARMLTNRASARPHQGWFGKVQRWVNGPAPKRGAALLERYGIVIIPLCFLTVGVQTAVNAAAGIVRMDWRRYTLAMLPGCVAWGTLYGLGLLAIWMTAVVALAGSPWAWLVLVLLVGVFVVFFRLQARRSRRLSQSVSDEVG